MDIMLARPLSQCSRQILGACAGLRPGHQILELGVCVCANSCFSSLEVSRFFGFGNPVRTARQRVLSVERIHPSRRNAEIKFHLGKNERQAVADSISLNADHRHRIAHDLKQLAASTSIGERIWRKSVQEAAVIIPLCHVAGTPSIAFTVRPEDEQRNSCSEAVKLQALT
eukprot:7772885-Pyramimonas_sp.AAC.1